ncbi:FIGNL1-interacting regulator of recombination and mitosis [Penaeus vannamei]|uniref:FIGNL1-interacting regulator of recombination and mitosis n=1 Tax=Penaeus vannamei TaxID=6689 RepID=UPI00387F85EB
MGSQKSPLNEENLMNILADAAHWTEEQTVEKLHGTLPVVIDFLQKSPPAEEGVQVARFVLGSFLPHLQIEESFSLLDATLPALGSFFDAFVQECEQGAKDSEDLPSRLLQQCVLITESCELMVQFLMQAENVLVKNVNNLPKVVLHVINGSLKHCRDSGTIYGDQQERVSEPLNLLFRQTVDLSTHFSGLLPKLVFDTYDDINILIDVCEQLPVTASCMSQLSEVRACVVVWRAYVSFIQHYHTHLITELDISLPIASLIKEISDGLLMMTGFSVQNKKMNDQDLKITQRIIKMTSFCMKIVISLCEKFKGYLHLAHRDLGKLLVLLYRFFPENLILQKFPDGVKTDMERQVAIGVEPLLSHLRDDVDFVKVVIDLGDEETEKTEEIGDWGSYLLLLIALSFPLSPAITLHFEALIDRTFQAIQKSHASLSYPCKVAGVMCGGKPQTNVTLYEHVLTRLCSTVAVLESESFEALEQLLIKWLLCGQTWPALMAADMWCFVARYGTSELCKHHCLVLSEILPRAPLHSHQQLVLTSLLKRLISKLSPADKVDFLSHLSSGSIERGDEVSLSCAVKENCMADQTKDIRKNLLNSCSQTIKAIVSKNASEDNVFDLLVKLEHIFPSLADFPLTDDEDAAAFAECIQDLAQLWARFPVEYIGCSAVDLLASGLLMTSSSALNHYSNDQLLQIISFCKESASQASPVFGVSICLLVAAAGQCSLLATSSSEVANVLECISDGLHKVLQSKNPFVYQCALDAFVAFGKHSVHENVLPSCLQKCEETLQGKVKKYLQQEVHSLSPGMSVCNLLQHQNVICCTDKTALSRKNYIPIEESLMAENISASSLISEGKDNLPQDFKSSKRKREDESVYSSLCDARSLMESLQESRNIIGKLKNRNEIEKIDRDGVIILLQEMISELSS